MVDHSLIFHIQLELTKFNDSMLWIHKNAPQGMTLFIVIVNTTVLYQGYVLELIQ